MHPRTGIYPGWIVILALFLTGMMVYGAGLYSFTLMVPPLSEEFGWSRAATGGLVSVFWLAAPLTTLGGLAVARIGAARLIYAGIVVEAACLLAVATVESLSVMYVLRALMGLGKIMMAAGVTAQASAWFGRRFGLAIAGCYAGWHFGGLALVPIAQYLIAVFGWRTACVVLAALIVVIALPPMLLFGSRRREGPLPASEAIDEPVAGEGGGDARAALRSGTFAAVVLVTLLGSFTYGALLTHEVAMIGAAGLTPALAATCLSVTAALALVGAVTVGHLTDRLGYRPVMALEYVLLATAVLLFLSQSSDPSASVMIIAAAAFGFAIGGFDICIVAHLRRSFGEGAFNHVFGVWYFFYLAMLFAGPIIAGWMYDRSGSYHGAMVAMLVGLAMGAVVLALGGVRRRPAPASS